MSETKQIDAPIEKIVVTFKSIRGNILQKRLEKTITVCNFGSTNFQKIRDLKQKVHELMGYAISTVKILFSGSVITDEDMTLERLRYEPKHFLVVLGRKRDRKKKKISPPKLVAPSITTPSGNQQNLSEKKDDSKITPGQPIQIGSNPPPVPVVDRSNDQPVVSETDSQTSRHLTFSTPQTTTPQNTQLQPPLDPPMRGPDPRILLEEQHGPNIKRLMEMGFDRDKVIKCLRAAYGDPSRATEYLISGIPEGIDLGEAPPIVPPRMNPLPPRQPQGSSGPLHEAPSVSLPVDDDNNDEVNPLLQLLGTDRQTIARQDEERESMENILRAFPGFNELRQAVQSNPELLRLILMRIGQTNPNLMRLIRENPGEFYNLMNAGPGNNPVITTPRAPTTSRGTLGTGFEMMTQDLPTRENQPRERQQPRQRVISVTPDEKAAIERIMALGFSRLDALQAYFACDKNETLAANFLFQENFQPNQGVNFNPSPKTPTPHENQENNAQQNQTTEQQPEVNQENNVQQNQTTEQQPEVNQENNAQQNQTSEQPESNKSEEKDEGKEKKTDDLDEKKE